MEFPISEGADNQNCRAAGKKRCVMPLMTILHVRGAGKRIPVYRRIARKNDDDIVFTLMCSSRHSGVLCACTRHVSGAGIWNPIRFSSTSRCEAENSRSGSGRLLLPECANHWRRDWSRVQKTSRGTESEMRAAPSLHRTPRLRFCAFKMRSSEVNRVRRSGQMFERLRSPTDFAHVETNAVTGQFDVRDRLIFDQSFDLSGLSFAATALRRSSIAGEASCRRASQHDGATHTSLDAKPIVTKRRKDSISRHQSRSLLTVDVIRHRACGLC